jgi:hypothetical protein
MSPFDTNNVPICVSFPSMHKVERTLGEARRPDRARLRQMMEPNSSFAPAEFANVTHDEICGGFDER